MNSVVDDFLILIRNGELSRVIRGDAFSFATPSSENYNAWPTDHSELLEKAVYPIANIIGVNFVEMALSKAIEDAIVDSLGVFCAIQLFQVQLVNERLGLSPIKIDREALPKKIAIAFQKESENIKHLNVPHKKPNMRCYKTSIAYMESAAKYSGIDWGIELPSNS